MSDNKGVYDYVVVLKNNHKKNILRTGWLFACLSILLLSVNLYYHPKDWLQYLYYVAVLFLTTSNLFDLRRKKPFRFAVILIVAGISILSNSIMPNIIGWLFILAGLCEKRLMQNKEIGFSTKDIIINGFFKKKINWEELNQVIIKADILTIDFKNNKLIQAETDDEEDEDYEVGDDEFNTFCRNRIGLKE
jgi:hypothetical protein